MHFIVLNLYVFHCFIVAPVCMHMTQTHSADDLEFHQSFLELCCEPGSLEMGCPLRLWISAFIAPAEEKSKQIV